MVTVARANPYGDTPTPRTFCNVSPLDPQLFSRICDFAEEMLQGKRSGKYSPIEVAQWLEDLADCSGGAISEGRQAGIGGVSAAGHRRGIADRAGPFLRR